MRISVSVSVLLVTATLSVKAQTLSAARFSSYCGLLQNKIYCYGGSQGTREKEISDSTMFVLEISTANETSMSELGNNWKVVSPTTAGVNTEKRENSQHAVVDNLLVLSGGFGGADVLTHIVDQTIAYDSENNSWKKYPNYFEGNINRQIYWGSAVEVPSKGLAFFGGVENHIDKNWVTPLIQNMTSVEFNNGHSRAIGYMGVVYLDIKNTNNPWSVPYQATVPTFSARQSSIFDPISKKIIYFGGTFEIPSAKGYVPGNYQNWYEFSFSHAFDTMTNIWAIQGWKGVTLPTRRAFHTTTLLPNGQSTVLLYGGEYNNVASADYCFTLDLKTHIWTQQNVNSNSVDLRRTRHSAILANNDSLFIVLGLDSISNVTSEPILLNITNPSVITYSEKYTDPHVLLAPNDPDDNNPNDTKNPDGHQASSGLSTGAIAGIAVGSVIAGILACTAIFFCLRKKRAEQQQKEQTSAQYHTTSIDPNSEPMEVNWDEIEKQYSEIPGSKLTESFHTAQVVNAPRSSFSREGNTPTTIISSVEQGYNTSPFTHNSNVSYPPNAVEQVQHQPFILKPDGGHSP